MIAAGGSQAMFPLIAQQHFGQSAQAPNGRVEDHEALVARLVRGHALPALGGAVNVARIVIANSARDC